MNKNQLKAISRMKLFAKANGITIPTLEGDNSKGFKVYKLVKITNNK